MEGRDKAGFFEPMECLSFVRLQKELAGAKSLSWTAIALWGQKRRKYKVTFAEW